MRILFFCILLTLSLLFSVSNAHIAINLDPEDLDQISDFFSMVIPNHQQNALIRLPLKFRILKVMKKTTIGLIQMLSVMIALVASNLITSKLEPTIPTTMTSSIVQLPKQHQKQTESDLLLRNISNYLNGVNNCNKDFGCHKNVCWRTCYARLKDTTKTWCYTSPIPNNRKYQPCTSAEECSACWECLNECQP